MNRLKTAQKYFMSEPQQANLDDLLDEITVIPCIDMAENFKGGTDRDQKMYQLNTTLSDWYAVVNQEGIIAYFGTIGEALHYRLDFINRILNS